MGARHLAATLVSLVSIVSVHVHSSIDVEAEQLRLATNPQAPSIIFPPTLPAFI